MRVFVLAFTFCLLVSSLVYAANDSLLSDEPFSNELDQIQGGVDKAQQLTDQDRYEFLGEQWKEFLLGFKPIKAVDGFLQYWNPVIVFLFARDYSFSLPFLFVFVLWIMTFFWLVDYVGLVTFDASSLSWTNTNGYKLIGAFAITIVFAHIQLFNYLAQAMMGALLYTYSIWSRIAIILLLLVSTFVYLFIMRYLGRYLKSIKDAHKKTAQERVEKSQKAFFKALGRGSSPS